jgi:hypothetical protein
MVDQPRVCRTQLLCIMRSPSQSTFSPTPEEQILDPVENAPDWPAEISPVSSFLFDWANEFEFHVVQSSLFLFQARSVLLPRSLKHFFLMQKQREHIGSQSLFFFSILSTVRALLWRMIQAKNLHLCSVLAFQTSVAGKKVIEPLNWHS